MATETVVATAARQQTRAERGRRDQRLPIATALVLAFGHVVLALLVFDPTPHTGGDSAGYITLARSLLERHAYIALYDPALPPASKYPPGYPAMLAAAMLLGVRSWVGLKLLMVAVSGAAVVLSYQWIGAWAAVGRGGGDGSRGGPEPAVGIAPAPAPAPGVAPAAEIAPAPAPAPAPGVIQATGLALGAGVVVAVSPGVLGLSHWILSDVPFWALTMAALWGFERAEQWDDDGAGANGDAARWLTVALGASVLAYFTRSAALPLLVAAGGWLLLRRRWRWLAGFATVVVPLVVLWSLRGRAIGTDYLGELLLVDPYRPALGRAAASELLGRSLVNALEYASVHLPALLFGDTGPVAQAVSFVILGVAGAGWALRLDRTGAAELFLPLYIGLLLVWPPVWAGERFLLPVLPLLLAYAGWALLRASAWVSDRTTRPLAGAAVLALVLLATPGLHAEIRHGTACTFAYLDGRPHACLPAAWQDFFGLAEWSTDALPDGAIVVSRKPRLFHALSGHRGLIYPFSQNPDVFFAAVKRAGARYLVVDRVSGLTARYVTPVLVARPQAFCMLHRLGPGRAALLGVRSPAAGGEPGWQAGSGPIALERCPDDYRRRPSR